MYPIDRLEAVSRSLVATHARMAATHPNWDAYRDVRVNVFSKSNGVLISTRLGMMFVQNHLIHGAWWTQYVVEQIAPAEGQGYVDAFDAFLKMAFIQGPHTVVENAFRLIVRNLDPSACAGGTAEFKSIYSFLFARLGLKQWEPLLELWR